MNQKQIILAIETSTTACSAAILIKDFDKNIAPQVFEVWDNVPRKHTELLLPMIELVLNQASCEMNQVTKLAFGCGPGAFTGVRIATSVIQALSYAHQINVISISSLAALAQQHLRLNGYENIIVANDARMNEIYLGCFSNQFGFMTLVGNESILKPVNLTTSIENFCSGIPAWTAVGSGWSEYNETLLPQIESIPYKSIICDSLPHAQDIAFLALDQSVSDEYEVDNLALPVYLRNDVAKKSIPK